MRFMTVGHGTLFAEEYGGSYAVQWLQEVQHSALGMVNEVGETIESFSNGDYGS